MYTDNTGHLWLNVLPGRSVESSAAAQCIERCTDIREILGSNPTGCTFKPPGAIFFIPLCMLPFRISTKIKLLEPSKIFLYGVYDRARRSKISRTRRGYLPV